MRKGQGLPINTIVLAAIAILVLVIIIAFATGSFSRLFRGAQTIEEQATPEQVSTFRIGCEQACFAAKQLADTQTEWKASDYCKRTLTNGSVKLHCWQTPISAECVSGGFSQTTC